MIRSPERKGGRMDRRQRKTRRAIYTAFEELMTQEHYSRVTVAQIIERADIGRSTFYAHFETKDELLASMCAEMFAHVFADVADDSDAHGGLDAGGLQGKLAHLLYHVRDAHGGLGAKLLAEGEPHFTSFFSEGLAGLLGGIISKGDAPADLLLAMRTSAFCRMVAWWHANDFATSPEQLAEWYLHA